MTEKQKGPTGYENWQAYLNGGRWSKGFEVQLYSDAWLTDEVLEGVGPYQFHNAVPAREQGTFAHVLSLRCREAVEYQTPDLSKTDTSRYHGGWLADELSALASLLVGIRLKPGRVTRMFDADDPIGRPHADTEAPPSPLPVRHQLRRIPNAAGTHNIREGLLPLLGSYPLLNVEQAVVLVRAARLFQDALWVAEAEPQLAWLLFVSSAEVVATQHQVDSNEPSETLKTSLPGLHRLLDDAGGKELVVQAAVELSRMLRATHRFLRFFEDFMPPPPPRPSENLVAISWDKKTLRLVLAKVYDLRSRALHDGLPFPLPMCTPPTVAGRYEERVGSIASGTNDAAWLSEDTPILLHVFEYLCRRAIIGWWQSIAKLDAKDNNGAPDSDAGSPPA